MNYTLVLSRLKAGIDAFLIRNMLCCSHPGSREKNSAFYHACMIILLKLFLLLNLAVLRPRKLNVLQVNVQVYILPSVKNAFSSQRFFWECKTNMLFKHLFPSKKQFT